MLLLKKLGETIPGTNKEFYNFGQGVKSSQYRLKDLLFLKFIITA